MSVLRVIEDDRFVSFVSETPAPRPEGSESAAGSPGSLTTVVRPDGEAGVRGEAMDLHDGLAEEEAPGVRHDGLAYEAHGSPPTHHVVESRETLWSIANDALGSALRWSEIARLNYGVVQSDGRALTVDHALRPGWHLELPVGHGAAVQREKGVPARPATMADRVPLVDQGLIPTAPWVSPAPGPQPVDRGVRVPRNVPLTPVGGGVVGAGVVSILDRMRKAQQRHRREGMFIKLPDLLGRTIEQRLRLGGGSALTDEVGEVLRDLTDDAQGPSRWISGVRVRTETIEVVLEDAGGPLGSIDDPSHHIVSVDRPVALAGGGLFGGRSPRVPAPTLVTAGNGPGGLVMVNLEALGSLVVEGEAEACEGVLRALALELATSIWSDRFDLALTGFGTELERFARVTSTEPGPLTDALWRLRMNRAAQLDGTRFASFAHARAVDAPGAWDPLVVLCGPTVASEHVAELVDVASEPALGMAVVAAGHRAGADHVVRLTTDRASPFLDLLGTVVFPQHVAADELAQVGALLETATQRQSAFSSDEPYVTLPIAVPAHPAPAAKAVGPSTARGAEDRFSQDDVVEPHLLAAWAAPASRPIDGQVEVAVLGPVEIRGLAREFTRASARELVIYLAMHPNGVTNEGWATALWPDRLMAPSSLHSTASVARRSLGQTADGLDHLPRSHGRLALAKSVVTDWERFVASADTDQADEWKAALSLVRGRPFEGIKSSDWPILEGIGPAIESAVVDLARRLGRSSLASGDAQVAEWAARRGLMVSPYDERLYRLLMRAADLDGNPAGVEAAMKELVTLVAEGLEPFDSVHPSTVDLYRSLTRRRRPAGTCQPPASDGRW
jgi:DNA-binding SARP family transcriptional activator